MFSSACRGVEPDTTGRPVEIDGQVTTRSCRPVARALVDLWHADENGEYDNSGFRYRGHLLTDAEVAKVSRAEDNARLVEGDHYVDLEDPSSGVHQVQARSGTPKHALPQSAVSDATWAKILHLVGR